MARPITSRPAARRTTGSPATFTDMVKLLPDRIDGWASQPPDRLCDRRTIYDYMDGAAEVYMTFAYAGLVVRTYRLTSRPDLIVELFDMTKPFDAFGVFTNGRDEELPDAKIGQGAERRTGLLTFWQDRFFVAIRVDSDVIEADQDSQRADAAMVELGRAIASAIGKTAPLPAILSILPAAGRIAHSERCFCSPAGLSYHYDLGDRNPLAIGPETRGVLSTYRRDKARFYLLCAQYPAADQAARAKHGLVAGFLGGVDAQGAAKLDTDLWAAVATDGDLLVACFDAPTRDAALLLVGQAVRQRRDPGRQPRNKEHKP